MVYLYYFSIKFLIKLKISVLEVYFEKFIEITSKFYNWYTIRFSREFFVRLFIQNISMIVDWFLISQRWRTLSHGLRLSFWYYCILYFDCTPDWSLNSYNLIVHLEVHVTSISQKKYNYMSSLAICGCVSRFPLLTNSTTATSVELSMSASYGRAPNDCIS